MIFFLHFTPHVLAFICCLLLVFAPSLLAMRFNRSAGGYLVFSLLLSPIIAFVYLLVLGRAPEPRDPRWQNLNDGVFRPAPPTTAHSPSDVFVAAQASDAQVMRFLLGALGVMVLVGGTHLGRQARRLITAEGCRRATLHGAHTEH